MRPMLATLADAPLRDPNLVYEPKYDGIRALIEARPGAVTVWSRLGNDKTLQFPEIVQAVAAWAARRRRPALLDGEIVALDQGGQPVGFQRLQDRIHLTLERDIARLAAERPVAFVAFDLLSDGEEDLCGRPLTERRQRLEAALRTAIGDGAGRVRLSPQVAGDGTALLAQAEAEGWEGLIVKDARSVYRPGQRSREWRKLKRVRRQEFVVGGWTEPRGSRARFGALLLGVPEGDRLRYVGHTGGGFSERALDHVGGLLAAREIARSPFTARPATNERPHWVRPELVVEVRFSEWTDEGYLRHPIYLGLRDDVPASSVRIEGTGRPTMPGSAPPVPPLAPSASASPASPASSSSRARLVAALEALERTRGGGTLDLGGGVAVEVGNLAKKLWPTLGITKGELLRYYVTVSPQLLPVVRDRPLVMRRFPNGIDRPAFYQHRAPDDVPAGVRAAAVSGDSEVPSRLIGGALATLLYTTQLASISQDPWFSRVQSPAEMDFAAIDLDPMEGASFGRVLDVARWVRDELAGLGVEGWAKTSGATGLHIYVPMRPGTPYEAGLLFCQIVATLVARRHPDVATVERVVRRRDASAVYVDYLQNIQGKTLASAYSARASDYAGASAPLTWAEIDAGVDPRELTIRTLPARLRQVGDLWAAFRRAKGVDLQAALERAQARYGSSG